MPETKGIREELPSKTIMPKLIKWANAWRKKIPKASNQDGISKEVLTDPSLSLILSFLNSSDYLLPK